MKDPQREILIYRRNGSTRRPLSNSSSKFRAVSSEAEDKAYIGGVSQKRQTTTEQSHGGDSLKAAPQEGVLLLV
jgi:hypothetical protein